MYTLGKQLEILYNIYSKSMLSNLNSSLIALAENEEILTKKYNYLISEIVTEIENLILIQYTLETKRLESVVNTAIHGSIHSSLLDSFTLKVQLK
jgi:hypothetical protein